MDWRLPCWGYYVMGVIPYGFWVGELAHVGLVLRCVGVCIMGCNIGCRVCECGFLWGLGCGCIGFGTCYVWFCSAFDARVFEGYLVWVVGFEVSLGGVVVGDYVSFGLLAEFC